MGRKPKLASSSSSDNNLKNTGKSEYNKQEKEHIPFVFHKITEYFLKELGSLQFSFKPEQCQEILTKIITAPFAEISNISSQNQDNNLDKISIIENGVENADPTTFSNITSMITTTLPTVAETTNNNIASDTFVLPKAASNSEYTEIRVDLNQNFKCTHKGPVFLGRRKLKLCMPEIQKIGAEFLLFGINESCEILQSLTINFIGRMRETKGSEAKTKARAKNNSQIIQEFECDTTTYKAMKTCKKCRLVLIRLPSEISSINEELNVYISAEHYTVLPDGGSKNSDEKDDLNSTDLDKERKRKLVEGKKPLSSKKTKIDDDEDAGDSTDEEVQNDDILPEIDETKIPNPYQDFIRRYKKALEKNVIKKERMKQEHYQEIDKFRNQIKDLEKKNKQLTKSCVKFARTIEKLTTQIAMYNSKITTPAEAPTSGQEILNTLSTAPSSVSSNIPTTEVAHNELHVDDDLTFFNDYDLDWSNFNDGKSAQPSHDLNKNDDESDLDLFETIHRN